DRDAYTPLRRSDDQLLAGVRIGLSLSDEVSLAADGFEVRCRGRAARRPGELAVAERIHLRPSGRLLRAPSRRLRTRRVVARGLFRRGPLRNPRPGCLPCPGTASEIDQGPQARRPQPGAGEHGEHDADNQDNAASPSAGRSWIIVITRSP